MEISKMVLSDRIKEQLLDDILSRKYRPGDRLKESELSKTFGVSQSPVREALQALEDMGLVVKEPYKGTRVRALTPRDIEEAFTVRASLESMAAALAARRRTDADIALLETLINHMVKAARDKDAPLRMQLNNRFHGEILRISGHGLVQRLSESLRFAGWSHLKGSGVPEEESVYLTTRHKKILDAIKSGDEEAARSAMFRHIIESMPAIQNDESGGE